MNDLTKQLQSAEAGSLLLDALLCKRFRPDLFNRHWSDARAMQPKGSSDDEVMQALLVRRGFPRVTTFVDAALALVKEVLPGWTWDCREQDDKSHYVTLQRGYRTSYDKVVSGHHKSPAIALCLALLSAAAVEGSDD
jgi:hypothetical protein